MRALLLILAAPTLTLGPAHAETVVALRTIPPGAVVAAADLGFAEEETPGAIEDPAAAVGLEARVALYAGRPVRPEDLGPAAVVERNALVPLVYQHGALLITAEGRALDRAGPGEVVSVMNLASRATVQARMGADGAAYVSP